MSAVAAVSDWLSALLERHQSLRAERSETLEIAGVPIRIRCAGADVVEALLPALAHHVRTRREPAFSILASDGWSGMPPFPWRLEDVGPKGEVAAATDGPIRTAYFVGSHTLSVADLERRVAVCWTRDARELPWYERAAPLRTLLHWILSANGRSLMHAAAVAPGERGPGVLLAGRGGSGKSTTALLCLGAGFRYAGDDYVAVTGDDGYRVHPLYGTAKLTRESLDRLPFLRPGLRVEPAGPEKGVVVLSDLPGGCPATSFPIAAVVVPRVAGLPQSRLRRASGAEALRALAPTTLFQLPGSGGAEFEGITALSRALPAWALELGTDFDAIPRLLAGLVAES